MACLPFLILSYVILFLSITLIMYQQMRTMVYDQTRQNIIEKTNLLNTLLNNSDQITTNYLYYTKDIQDYLMTDQEPLSQDAVEELHQSLASHTALLLTDHNPEIAQVSLFTEPLPAKAGRFDLLLKQPNPDKPEKFFCISSKFQVQ